MRTIQMLVVVHKCCKNLPNREKVPLLLWVDQPQPTITITDADTGNPIGQTPSGKPYGIFTHLIWLSGLTDPKIYHLTISAHKDGFNHATQNHDIDRIHLRGGDLKNAPTITYPSPDQSVHSAFPVWGSVANQPCTAWLVDDNNDIYPGSPIPGQTAPNFGFSFQNIPGGAGAGMHYTLYVQAADGTQKNEDIYVQSGI